MARKNREQGSLECRVSGALGVRGWGILVSCVDGSELDQCHLWEAEEEFRLFPLRDTELLLE